MELLSKFSMKIKNFLRKTAKNHFVDKEVGFEVTTESKYNFKIVDNFKCTLMSLCWFTLRSSSNLDVGMKVNVRRATEERLTAMGENNKPSVLDAIYEDGDTFQNSRIDCAFFKIKKNDPKEHAPHEKYQKYTKLTSFYTPSVIKTNHERINDPVVEIDDYTAELVGHEDVEALAFVLSVKSLKRPNEDDGKVYDMKTVLTTLSKHDISNEEDMQNFLSMIDMNFFKLKRDQNILWNMNRFRNFLRVLTPIFVNMVEGNHRMQTASQCLFGHDIRKEYPQQFYTLAHIVPKLSTARRRIATRILFASGHVFHAVEKLQKLSGLIQGDKNLIIQPTAKDMLEEIHNAILNHEGYSNFHENVREFANSGQLLKNQKKKGNHDKFLLAHNVICECINKVITTSSSNWLTKQIMFVQSHHGDGGEVEHHDFREAWTTYTKESDKFLGYGSHSNPLTFKLKTKEASKFDMQAYLKKVRSWASRSTNENARKVFENISDAHFHWLAIYSLFLGIGWTKAGMQVLAKYIKKRSKGEKNAYPFSIHEMSFIAQYLVFPINTAQEFLYKELDKHIEKRYIQRTYKIIWMYRHQWFKTFLLTVASTPLTTQFEDQPILEKICEIAKKVDSGKSEGIIVPKFPLEAILLTYPELVHKWLLRQTRETSPLDSAVFADTSISLHECIASKEQNGVFLADGIVSKEWRFPNCWKLHLHVGNIVTGDVSWKFKFNIHQTASTPDKKKRTRKAPDTRASKRQKKQKTNEMDKHDQEEIEDEAKIEDEEMQDVPEEDHYDDQKMPAKKKKESVTECMKNSNWILKAWMLNLKKVK